MVYIIAVVSALVTGLLCSTAAYAMGVYHGGILFAIGIMGAGIQVIILIGWYLHYARERDATDDLIEPVMEDYASGRGDTSMTPKGLS